MVLYEPSEPKKVSTYTLKECNALVNILKDKGYDFKSSRLYSVIKDDNKEYEKFSKLFK